MTERNGEAGGRGESSLDRLRANQQFISFSRFASTTVIRRSILPGTPATRSPPIIARLTLGAASRTRKRIRNPSEP